MSPLSDVLDTAADVIEAVDPPLIKDMACGELPENCAKREMPKENE
jgi:hypothetical protein